jgi:hypothetical protein
MSPEMLHALCVSLSGSFREYVFVPASQSNHFVAEVIINYTVASRGPMAVS